MMMKRTLFKVIIFSYCIFTTSFDAAAENKGYFQGALERLSSCIFHYWPLKERSFKVVINTIASRITRAPRYVVDNAALGEVSFKGYSSGAFRTAAQVKAEVNGTPSGSAVPGRLLFSTANTAGVNTEHMRIQADGKIGINTPSPNAKVTIQGSSSPGADSVVHIGSSATSLDSSVTSVINSLQIDGNLFVGGSSNIGENFSTTKKGKLYFTTDTTYMPITNGLKLPFTSKIDPGSTITTGANAAFTVPETGYYILTLQIVSTLGIANSAAVEICIIKNGSNNSATNVIKSYEYANSSTAIYSTLAGIVILNAGDVVSATVTPRRANGSLASGTITLVSGVNGTNLTFHRLTTGGTT